jgi:hypothetical protein
MNYIVNEGALIYLSKFDTIVISGNNLNSNLIDE